MSRPILWIRVGWRRSDMVEDVISMQGRFTSVGQSTLTLAFGGYFLSTLV